MISEKALEALEEHGLEVQGPRYVSPADRVFITRHGEMVKITHFHRVEAFLLSLPPKGQN